MPIEDRIEKLARLVLVVLLVATLGWVAKGHAQGSAQGDAGSAAEEPEVRHQLRLLRA